MMPAAEMILFDKLFVIIMACLVLLPFGVGTLYWLFEKRRYKKMWCELIEKEVEEGQICTAFNDPDETFVCSEECAMCCYLEEGEDE